VHGVILSGVSGNPDNGWAIHFVDSARSVYCARWSIAAMVDSSRWWIVADGPLQWIFNW